MATAQYDKENTRRINLKLNIKTDADIIQRLKAQENIQGYLKHLIRKDMENNAPNETEIMQPVRFISENEQAWTDNNGIKYIRKKEKGTWGEWKKDR